MKNFKGYIETEKFKIGCTGQMVYVYDKDGNEVKKFKDLIYAYAPAVSPLGDILVVKSTEGRLAVYSLKTLSLIKKFRFSKVNYAQDDGFCFSSDGKYFINIERHNDELHSAISVYNTETFAVESRLLLDDKMMLCHVQESRGEYYVLGFLRGDDMIITTGFVAKYRNNEILDIMNITENELDFYTDHLCQTMFGFEFAQNKKIEIVHTLEELWNYYHDKQNI